MIQSHPYRILPYNRYSSFYQERESFYRSFINQYYLDFAHQVLLQEAIGSVSDQDLDRAARYPIRSHSPPGYLEDRDAVFPGKRHQ